MSDNKPPAPRVSPEAIPLDLEKADKIIETASEELGRLCEARWEGGDAWEKAWHWEIPANPARDTDLRIGDAIGLAKDAVTELRRLRASLGTPRLTGQELAEKHGIKVKPDQAAVDLLTGKRVDVEPLGTPAPAPLAKSGREDLLDQFLANWLPSLRAVVHKAFHVCDDSEERMEDDFIRIDPEQFRELCEALGAFGDDSHEGLELMEEQFKATQAPAPLNKGGEDLGPPKTGDASRLTEPETIFDFRSHLARQAEFSAATFGPGARVKGVTDHIRKELEEVEKSNGSLNEWIDVVILGLDGAWRSGVSPDEIIAAMVHKQAKNEARKWPDWRTADPTKAIEHDRTGEKRECEGCRWAGFDIADGPWCGNPKVTKENPYGLSLSSMRLVEFCRAPEHPLWESKAAPKAASETPGEAPEPVQSPSTPPPAAVGGEGRRFAGETEDPGCPHGHMDRMACRKCTTDYFPEAPVRDGEGEGAVKDAN